MAKVKNCKRSIESVAYRDSKTSAVDFFTKAYVARKLDCIGVREFERFNLNESHCQIVVVDQFVEGIRDWTSKIVDY